MSSLARLILAVAALLGSLAITVPPARHLAVTALVALGVALLLLPLVGLLAFLVRQHRAGVARVRAYQARLNRQARTEARTIDARPAGPVRDRLANGRTITRTR